MFQDSWGLRTHQNNLLYNLAYQHQRHHHDYYTRLGTHTNPSHHPVLYNPLPFLPLKKKKMNEWMWENKDASMCFNIALLKMTPMVSSRFYSPLQVIQAKCNWCSCWDHWNVNYFEIHLKIEKGLSFILENDTNYGYPQGCVVKWFYNICYSFV